MDERNSLETTQTRKKKTPIGKIIFLLLACVAIFLIWHNYTEKQQELEANTVRYEDVMNDPYTEEDIVVLDTVQQIRSYADFVADNPNDELYLFNSYYEARNLAYRLHGFLTYGEYGLCGINLKCDGSVVTDKACHDIMFNELSHKGQLEYVAICKEIYSTLGSTYDLFSAGADCHNFDKALEDFRIVREPETVEEPPKELTATQQKIAEWKEDFLTWSAEVQAKNRERLAEQQATSSD